MRLYRWIIAALWLLFIVYWTIAAVGVKRSASRRAWRREIGLRLVVVLLTLVLLHSRTFRQVAQETRHSVGASAIAGWIGAVLCLLGVGLAIHARRHLGRNWGMPMSRKEQPELVTTGPYTLIRHPIYTGLLLAMLGSTLGVNFFFLPLLLVAGAYFIYSAQREEALMLQQFPAQYAAYRACTGMIVPRLLHRR